MSQGANSDVHRATGDFRVELLRQLRWKRVVELSGWAIPGKRRRRWEKKLNRSSSLTSRDATQMLQMQRRVERRKSRAFYTAGNGLNGCRCAGVKI